MASTWADRAGYFLVVVAVIVMPVKVSTQSAAFSGKKTITNPDFPCGRPYGPNGEPPSSSRAKRQIIFPDEPIYQHYWGLLSYKGPSNPGTREGETSLANLDTGDTFCGASVISDHFLITAAHCVFSETKPINSVRLGDIDLTSDTESNSKPIDHEIEFIFAHEGYNPNSKVRHNDIALLRTKEKIQFNDVVFPYCISAEPPTPGTIVTAAGFGLYNATNKPNHLLEANFTIVDTAKCQDIYLRENQEAGLRVRYPNLIVGTDIICAEDDESDACQGDSGGPMFLEKNGKRYLEGIVSGGADCRGNFKSVLPGLYLSIAKHVNFIDHFVFGSLPELINPPPAPLDPSAAPV